MSNAPSVLDLPMTYVGKDSVIVGNGASFNYHSYRLPFPYSKSSFIHLTEDLLSISKLTSDFPVVVIFIDNRFFIQNRQTRRKGGSNRSLFALFGLYFLPWPCRVLLWHRRSLLFLSPPIWSVLIPCSHVLRLVLSRVAAPQILVSSAPLAFFRHFLPLLSLRASNLLLRILPGLPPWMKKFEICSITAPGFWSLALPTPTLGAPNGCFEPNIFLMALSRDSRLILLPSYSIFLGVNLVSWSAIKQPTASRSSCESEYRALTRTIVELLWLIHLLCDLRVSIPKPPLLLCDNKSEIFLSSNPVSISTPSMLHVAFHL